MFYKVLNGLNAMYGRTFTYQIGEWSPWVNYNDMSMCERGYHFCQSVSDLLEWIGPDIYECQVAGQVKHNKDKGLAQSIRLVRRIGAWNDRTARLFACDCAERVVHLCGDNRSANVINVARQYANGVASNEELVAARDASRKAAWEASIDASWENTARAVSKTTARIAARAAARNSAWDAAWNAAMAASLDAAMAVSWDEERKWQTALLKQYLNEEN